MIEIKEIVNNIFASKTYILYQNSCDKAWIVDVGDTEPIIDFIVEGGLSVLGVFFTHSHFDHIYGINELYKKIPYFNIYTSEFGKAALKDAKKNLSLYNGYSMDYINDNVIVLSDGDIIGIFDDVSLNIISTPGHCPSCLTYYTDDYIFTGDSYIPGIKVVTNLPKGNKIQAQESVEKIKELAKNRIICPGHGQIITQQLYKNLYIKTPFQVQKP